MILAIEGIDRIGKSTLCDCLRELCNNREIFNNFIHFPFLTKTDTDVFYPQLGNILITDPDISIINNFLNKNISLDNKTIYNLFYANRTSNIGYKVIEKFKKNCDILNERGVLILDRYTYSGVVYGMANGLSEKYCYNYEKNNKWKPDLIVYLRPTNIDDIDILFDNDMAYSDCFEKTEFQRRVSQLYDSLFLNINKVVGSTSIKTYNIDVKNRSLENTQQICEDILNTLMYLPTTNKTTIIEE